MDTKEILRWTVKIMVIIVLVIVITKLSYKCGEGRVMINGLAFALLLFSVGKLLLKNKK
jgi:hypothetical protein